MPSNREREREQYYSVAHKTQLTYYSSAACLHSVRVSMRFAVKKKNEFSIVCCVHMKEHKIEFEKEERKKKSKRDCL